MHLAPAETAIMEVLWRESPRSPEELIAEVGPAQGWAEGTVRTLITRLLRKKAVAGYRQDGAYFYRPLISRSEYVRSASQGLLDRLFGGEVAPFVANLAEHRALSAKDVETLKQVIADIEDKGEAGQ